MVYRNLAEKVDPEHRYSISEVENMLRGGRIDDVFYLIHNDSDNDLWTDKIDLSDKKALERVGESITDIVKQAYLTSDSDLQSKANAIESFFYNAKLFYPQSASADGEYVDLPMLVPQTSLSRSDSIGDVESSGFSGSDISAILEEIKDEQKLKDYGLQDTSLSDEDFYEDNQSQPVDFSGSSYDSDSPKKDYASEDVSESSVLSKASPAGWFKKKFAWMLAAVSIGAMALTPTLAFDPSNCTRSPPYLQSKRNVQYHLTERQKAYVKEKEDGYIFEIKNKEYFCLYPEKIGYETTAMMEREGPTGFVRSLLKDDAKDNLCVIDESLWAMQGYDLQAGIQDKVYVPDSDTERVLPGDRRTSPGEDGFLDRFKENLNARQIAARLKLPNSLKKFFKPRYVDGSCSGVCGSQSNGTVNTDRSLEKESQKNKASENRSGSSWVDDTVYPWNGGYNQ